MANNNFAGHVLTGLFAARPAANAVPAGTLYSATNTGIVYQSDGVATWATWATLGGGTPTGVGCRVYNNANISIVTSGTPQILTFNSERFDTDGFHDNAVNTDRITIPTGKGGIYLIFAGVQFAANPTGFRELAIDVNGTTIVAPLHPAAVGGGIITIMSVSTVYQLAQGDIVRCIVNQGSGGALNVDAAGNYSPEFGVTRLGS